MATGDNIVFYGSLVVTSVFIYVVKKHNKPLFYISIALFVVYSSYFIYNLFYNSKYGAGLVWWFYLIFISCLHSVVLIIYLLVKKYKSWKRRLNDL